MRNERDFFPKFGYSEKKDIGKLLRKILCPRILKEE